MMHIFALVLGLGGATLNDLFFFKFLRDFRIVDWEKIVLHTFSRIIWIGLTLFFISGLALFICEWERLIASSKFQLKLVVVSVIFGNGILLNMYIAPRLLELSYGEHAIFSSRSTLLAKRVAFAGGGISFVSWYGAFFLGMLDSLPFTFWQLLILYILALLCAVIGALTVEKHVALQATKHKQHQ